MVPTLGDLRRARRGSAVDRMAVPLIWVPFFYGQTKSPGVVPGLFLLQIAGLRVDCVIRIVARLFPAYVGHSAQARDVFPVFPVFILKYGFPITVFVLFVNTVLRANPRFKYGYKFFPNIHFFRFFPRRRGVIE